MADWTANSGLGALGASREPVFRTRREPALRGENLRPEPRLKGEALQPAELRAESLRAEARMPAAEASPRLRPGAAALAQYNAAVNGPLAKARFAVWAGGGVLSLLLLGGVGVWGYKLVLREVMGLPVVVAETGPMRVLPADPEGEVVPSQGLSVNAIPAAGTAAAPSDVLVLAPQTAGLAEEDMEVVQTNAEAGEVMPAAPVVSAAAADPVAPMVAEPAAAPVAAAPAGPAPVVQTASLTASAPMTLDEVLATADSVAAQAQPAGPVASAPALSAVAPVVAEAPAVAEAPVEVASLAPVAPPVAPVEATVAVPAAPEAVAAVVVPQAAQVVATIPATVPGVVSARRPATRPAALGAAPAVPAAVVAITPAPAEAAPVAAAAAGPAITPDLPAGTHLVQLGAFDSPEIAAAEWDRLQGRFGDFLGGKERVIQETQSNGRTFYRLRAMGFGDRADARILCAALTAEDAACIPVTVD